MDKKIVSREYVSVTKCDLLSDGTWKAITEVYDSVLRDGDTEWVKEKVEAMAMDDTPDKAIKVSMDSVLAYIVENVYKNGFASLVEYREFKRNMEEGRKALQDATKTSSV